MSKVVGPGTRLGCYEIVEQIGAGGMGAVYRAKDARLPRQVAIKVILPEHAVEQIARERFDREARAIAALNHPRICTLHDVGHEDGVDYIVMEHVDGETLGRHLMRGLMPLGLVVDYAIQIADALEFAHRKGFVHRDLKPGNVMITPSGVKLLDFGLAMRSSFAAPSVAQATAATTQPGTIAGSLAYMAPEQLRGEAIDPRADLWAFGAVLFEMATGQRAFSGDSATIIAAILERESPNVRALRPDLPPLFARIIDRCLVKNRDGRWQSARDISGTLDWVKDPDSSPATPRLLKRVRTMTGWTIAALAIAALGVGMERWLVPRSPTGYSTPERVQIVTPPSSDPLAMAIAPDGRRVVVSGSDGKVDRLFVYSLDSGVVQPLEGTQSAKGPFWSSDSGSIGFFADGWLKSVSLSSGAVTELTRVPSARGATWHGDTIVYSPYSVAVLHRIVLGDGPPVPITSLDIGNGQGHRSPRFFPDGRHLLFYASGAPDGTGVYVTDIDGHQPRRVLLRNADGTAGPLQAGGSAVPFDANHLLFVDDGTLYEQRVNPQRYELEGSRVQLASSVSFDEGLSAVSVSTSGAIAFRAGGPVTRQFVWLDRAGTVLTRLGEPDPVILAPEVSSNGKQVLFQRKTSGWDLWTMNAERGGPVRLTSDPQSEWCPIWSPKGDRVAFASNRNGQFDLYEKVADLGAPDHLLLSSPAAKLPMDWSNNGYLMYRTTDPKTGINDLWAKAVGRDEPPIPVANTKADEREGQFSPDGRWVAYQSDEAVTSQFEIYVQRFPTGTDRTRVSFSGGAQARWNPNGKEIFYIDPEGRLMAATFSSVSSAGAPVIGIGKVLFQTGILNGQVPGANKQQYAVSPDGLRFLVNRNAIQPSLPITLILHWTPPDR